MGAEDGEEENHREDETVGELIHYDPGDMTHLANAMCVNVLDNGNTSNKELWMCHDMV